MDLIPGSGRSPAEGNSDPLQYSCLEHPMDRGAWRVTAPAITKPGKNTGGGCHALGLNPPSHAFCIGRRCLIHEATGGALLQYREAQKPAAK